MAYDPYKPNLEGQREPLIHACERKPNRMKGKWKAFAPIKPAKINLSLFGRLLGALEGADHVDLIEGAIGSEVDDDRKAEGKHHGKHVAQRLDFDVKVQ